ncbi:hypothetical protein [Ralstonia solanacearum]|uniref:hypothetical protein n=1 Tax=Ralstonia solanacearum TaxID=305 RepID=UPI001FF8CCC1|nr:hypothetical protein [Ralstonia solanacearum]
MALLHKFLRRMGLLGNSDALANIGRIFRTTAARPFHTRGHNAKHYLAETMHMLRKLWKAGGVLSTMFLLNGCGVFLFGKYEPPALAPDKTTHITFQNDYSSTTHLLVAEKPGACVSANKRFGWQPNGMLPYGEAVQFDVARGEPVHIDIFDQADNGVSYWSCAIDNVYTFDRADVTLRFTRAPRGCKVEFTDASGAPVTPRMEPYDWQVCHPTPQPINSRSN